LIGNTTGLRPVDNCQFLLHNAMHSTSIEVLSVMLWYFVKMAKHINEITLLPCIPID